MARTRIKPMLKVVSVVALTLLVAAGSAAFAAPQQQQPPGQQNPPGPGLVGGTGVPVGKYPFMVAILDTTKGGNTYNQQFCGGTLINSTSVLTAAHCTEGLFASEMRVVVGRTQLNSNQGQEYPVGREFIHDKYTGAKGDYKYDVAVLKLPRGTHVTGITPVRLPPSTENYGEQPGRRLTIAGWGNTTFTGSPTNSMREAVVPVVSDADGAKSYPKQFVPELMIAAGGNGTDTCPGDSGGPLFKGAVSFGKTTPGSPPRQPPPPTQYGITSFGGSDTQLCGGAEPGVYTEVNEPSIRVFIADKMLNRLGTATVN